MRRVARISDRDPALLRDLQSQGIVVDARITPAMRADLDQAALDAIWVVVDYRLRRAA